LDVNVVEEDAVDAAEIDNNRLRNRRNAPTGDSGFQSLRIHLHYDKKSIDKCVLSKINVFIKFKF
uniref:Ovule protein n=1 Tax=Gongylonema pulchrum TaxID=637853 RepID=A0A183DL31_9BILA